MNINTSICRGYGFEFVPQDVEVVKEFIKSGDIFLPSGFDNCSTIEELTDIFEDYEPQYGENGLGGVIADVMSEKEGVDFAYRKNNESTPVIMFEENFPWNYNSKEKGLTAESLEYIAKRSIDKMDLDVEPGFCSIEYYG